jgi:hypothetical protein
MKNKPLSPESRKLMLDNCNGCIISNDTPCEMGLSASHFFKSNTMKLNIHWDYSDPNNAVVMCSKHHDEFEKLNAEDRIRYIKKYSKVDFTDKIVSRMKALLGQRKPKPIYPEVNIQRVAAINSFKAIRKAFLPDEHF